MLTRMCFDVLMNRGMREDEHPSPGGFTVELAGGRNLTFDFFESSSGRKTDEPVVLHAEMNDTDFEYAASLSDVRGEDVTRSDFSGLKEWKDFYIDLEDCGEDLYPVSITGLSLEFLEDGEYVTWDAPTEVLEQINALFAEYTKEVERGE